MFISVKYKAVATRINMESKTAKILAYISKNGGASKYDFVTNVLGKKGSRQKLRGYYSVWSNNMVRGGILTLDKGIYRITELGKARLFAAFIRSYSA